MANAIKWEALLSDRSTVLTTELNALANDARTNAGSAIDNGANLDRFGWLELNVDFVSAPSAGGYCAIYMVTALDGTNYDDGSSSVDPGAHTWILSIPVRADTAAQRLHGQRFELPPCPVKFILENKTGQAFPASGSTLELFTGNEEVQ